MNEEIKYWMEQCPDYCLDTSYYEELSDEEIRMNLRHIATSGFAVYPDDTYIVLSLKQLIAVCDTDDSTRLKRLIDTNKRLSEKIIELNNKLEKNN